jgi:predicted RNA polymerase sigma factor
MPRNIREYLRVLQPQSIADYWAARAGLLRASGARDAADAAYRRAIGLEILAKAKGGVARHR